MTVLLLMMTLTGFSQSTSRLVKNTTLVKIMKEIEYCDSLQVAYDDKTKQLDELIDTNLIVFNKLESERINRIKAQEQVDKLQKNILKESKKNKNGILYGIGGIILGIITVLSLN